MNDRPNMFQLRGALEVRLEQLRFAAQLRIEESLLRDGFGGGVHRLEWLRDFIDEKYVLSVRSKFYGKLLDFELPPVPVTWWDHFKRDAIPTFTRWLRLGINERRETLRAATIFPDVPQLPGDRFYYRDVVPTQRAAE